MTSLANNSPHAAEQSAFDPAPPPGRRTSRRPIWLWLVAALALVPIIIFAIGLLPNTEPAPPVTPAPAVPVTAARGRVLPGQEARIATLVGGVVSDVPVAVGQAVRRQQPVARVRGPNGLELLTSPWAGTVTDILVQEGDSVAPGQRIVTLADLSDLHVETDDVDEFLIAGIQAGQSVTLTVDALEDIEAWGQVITVAPAPRTTTAGDQHYPVRIVLSDPDPAIKPGMSVRVTFLPDQD